MLMLSLHEDVVVPVPPSSRMLLKVLMLRLLLQLLVMIALLSPWLLIVVMGCPLDNLRPLHPHRLSRPPPRLRQLSLTEAALHSLERVDALSHRAQVRRFRDPSRGSYAPLRPAAPDAACTFLRELRRCVA
jgi:hypothetical protein